MDFRVLNPEVSTRTSRPAALLLPTNQVPNDLEPHLDLDLLLLGPDLDLHGAPLSSEDPVALEQAGEARLALGGDELEEGSQVLCAKT